MSATRKAAGRRAVALDWLAGDNAGLEHAGADFTGADLRGSVLTAFDPRVAQLRSAIITADQAVDLAMSLDLQIRVS